MRFKQGVAERDETLLARHLPNTQFHGVLQTTTDDDDRSR